MLISPHARNTLLSEGSEMDFDHEIMKSGHSGTKMWTFTKCVDVRTKVRGNHT